MKGPGAKHRPGPFTCENAFRRPAEGIFRGRGEEGGIANPAVKPDLFRELIRGWRAGQDVGPANRRQDLDWHNPVRRVP